mmetsp:Transcript_10472/g.14796  ORF Transcript_10472/g.14796 Transcript_10472/m.14796 type:complete len:230 (+) Transcript_10472:85-774(+)
MNTISGNIKKAPITRSVVLGLYRRCLRSCQRIPEPDQRSVYEILIRSGFRKHKNDIHVGSRAQYLAVLKCEEELSSMNYYHSVVLAAKQSHDEQQSRSVTRSIDSSSVSSSSSSVSSTTTSSSSSHQETFIRNEDAKNNAVINCPNTNKMESFDFINNEKLDIVKKWLVHAIPQLHEADVSLYAHKLVEEGFDTVGLLEMELQVDDDLDFMKKVHKRILVRWLQSRAKS